MTTNMQQHSFYFKNSTEARIVLAIADEFGFPAMLEIDPDCGDIANVLITRFDDQTDSFFSALELAGLWYAYDVVPASENGWLFSV